MPIVQLGTQQLPAPVAAGESVTFPYPPGTIQGDFTGARSAPMGSVAVNSNDIYVESDETIAFTYGVSTIEVENATGVTWPTGARITAVGAWKTPSETADEVGAIGPYAEAIGLGLIEASVTYDEWADIYLKPEPGAPGTNATIFVATAEPAPGSVPNNSLVFVKAPA